MAIPGAPTSLSVTTTPLNNGNFTIALAYTPPASDGGSPITAYWLSIADNYSGGLPYEVNIGLSNPAVRSSFDFTLYGTSFLRAAIFNSNYRLRMRAQNADGYGPYSEYVEFYPYSTYYQVIRLTPNSIRVSFDPFVMPNAPLSVSAVGDGDALNPNTWPILHAGTAPTAPTSVTKFNNYVFDLIGIPTTTFSFIRTPEVTFSGALRLTDGSKFKVGISVLYNPTLSDPLMGKPTTPALAVTSVAPGTVSFEVTPSTTNYPSLPLSYEIVSTPTYNFYGYEVVTLDAENKFSISGLTNEVEYTFKLRSYVLQDPGTQLNAQITASTWSSEVVATPTASTAPGAPTITSVTPGYYTAVAATLNVTYLAPADDGGSPITGYEFSLDGGATVQPCIFPPGPFSCGPLAFSTVYSVIIRAINAIGAGAWSAPVSAETGAAIPSYRVYAVSDRVVRIIFDSDVIPAVPVHVSSTGTKDALNPRSWNVIQPYGITYTVLSVIGSDDGYTYDILTLEHFPRYNAGDLTFTGQVRLENGDEPTISTEFSGSIQSADTSANAKATTRGLQVRDLNNVVTPYADLVGGTLVINSGGDYESMSGEAFIRKLVMRRLISQKGDFFHLPNYGGGLRVKTTFSTANLRAMAKDIEMQVLQEPEIEAARASLTYQAASSTLVIQVKARMRSTGQETALSMNLPVGSIQF